MIAEKYNIRADFNPLPLFRHSVRIVVILIKAGGCFKSKEKLVGKGMKCMIFKAKIDDFQNLLKIMAAES